MSAVALTVQALLDAGGVTAVTSTRIFPGPLRMGTQLPAISVDLLSEDIGYTLAGAADYPLSVVTVSCIAQTGKAAMELGEEVKDALKDYRAAPVSGGASASFMKQASDLSDYASDFSTYRRIMSFAVRWR